MKKIRQIAAFLLSAMMVFSCLAVGVSAAEPPEDWEITAAEAAGEEAQAEEAEQPETLSVGGNFNFDIVTEVFEYGQDVVAVIIDVG